MRNTKKMIFLKYLPMYVFTYIFLKNRKNMFIYASWQNLGSFTYIMLKMTKFFDKLFFVRILMDIFLGNDPMVMKTKTVLHNIDKNSFEERYFLFCSVLVTTRLNMLLSPLLPGWLSILESWRHALHMLILCCVHAEHMPSTCWVRIDNMLTKINANVGLYCPLE